MDNFLNKQGGLKRKKNPKQILIAAIAASVTVVVFLVILQQRAPSTGVAPPPPPATTLAVVAVADIKADIPVAAVAVAVQPVPVSTIPAGAKVFTDPTKVATHFLAVPVSKGQVILQSYLADASVTPVTGTGTGTGTTPAVIAPLLVGSGDVAIALPIDDVHGVAGWLRPGDHIDFFVNQAPGNIHFAFQDVPVLRTGTPAAQGAGGALAMLVVELPREKAAALAYLFTLGPPYTGVDRVVLRSHADDGKGVIPGSSPVGAPNLAGILDG